MKRNQIEQPSDSSKSIDKSVFKKIFIDEHEMLSINIYDNQNRLTRDLEAEVKELQIKTIKEKSNQTWKFAAAVVDRLCMFLFLIMNSLFTLIMIFLQIYFNQ